MNKTLRILLIATALALPWLVRAVDDVLDPATIGAALPSKSIVVPTELTGTVVDAVTHEPVPLAYVVAGDQVRRTDDEGHFVINGTSELTALSARAPGYLRWQGAVSNSLGELTVPLQPFRPKAIYLSIYGIGDSKLRGAALRLTEQTELNALVIDVKGDRSLVPYRSAALAAAGIGPQEIVTVKNMPALIRSLHDKGLYLIGRIVTFKDDRLANAKPQWAVRTAEGEIWKDLEGLSWIDPSRQEAWGTALSLAEEAAQMGFDEIQFDYVRFPDTAGLHFSIPNNAANRTATITRFLDTAKQRLARYNVFIGADIFGYTCWNEGDIAIGQNLEMLSDRIDYLSPMLYPSGFGAGIPGHRDAVKSSYEIVNHSLLSGQARTGMPGQRWRPWLQAFKDYAFDRRRFGANEIRAQIDAAEASNSNGWILWNARNQYSAAGLKPRTTALSARQPFQTTVLAVSAAASAPAHMEQ